MQAAVAEARATGDRAVTAAMELLHIDYSGGILESDGIDNVLRRASEVLSQLARSGADVILARLHVMIARWLMGAKQDPSGASQHAQLAVAHARRAGYMADERHALSTHMFGLVVGPTPVDVARRRLEDVLATAGDLALTERCWQYLALLAAMQGDIEGARGFLAEMGEAVHVLGLPDSYTAGTAAQVEELAGDLAVAEQEMRRSVQGMIDQHAIENLSSYAPMLADILIDRNKCEDAGRYLDLAERYAAVGDLDANYRITRARARLLLRQGRLEDAERAARRAQELVADTSKTTDKADADMSLAEVLAASGRHDAAATLIRQAQEQYVAKGMSVRARRAGAALAALSLGQPQERRE
jgi:hypothetical protein